MSYDIQQNCPVATESPRSLAKKIEHCIVRNAFDEECRAQKALRLLKARDRRIAYLEKRVAELEETAADMHEMSLQASSTLSSLDCPTNKEDAFYSVSHSERSIKTENDYCRTYRQRGSLDRSSHGSSQIKIPNLRLSSGPSYLDKETFSAPALNVCYQKASDSSETNRDYVYVGSFDTNEPRSRSMKEIHSNGADDRAKEISPKEDTPFESVSLEKRWSEQNQGKFPTMEKDDERKDRASSHGRNYETKFPSEVSSSVAWIRTKRNFRKKIRPFVGRTRKRQKGDQRLEKIDVSYFRTIETVSRANEDDDVDAVGPALDSKVFKNSRTPEKKNETGSDVEKERIIAVQGNHVECKTVFTQTYKSWSDQEQRNSNGDGNDYTSHSTPSLFYDSRKRWGKVEDPAPQWLIEEALNRGNEVCKEKGWQKSLESINKEAKYENIISELEKKLTETKKELEETVKKKNVIREKYKRALKNSKMTAHQESEALQRKIVHFYSVLLEKLNSYMFADNKKIVCQHKNRKPSKYVKKMSKRLYKKLKAMIKISQKLKDELTKTQEKLKDKSEKYESVNKCFELLKQEMENTEVNLNDLIAENASLRKKFEDMKDWMELKIGKEQNERISATQIRELPKYRELANLKKKSEEDCATIKQLHKKLLRSGAANANKGFLLNSYKGQLSELTKEKDQLTSKIKELENEMTALRTSNAQLKAKISLLSQDKENLSCKMTKSETDWKQQIEAQLNQKYEESMREEINFVKTKCEDTIKVLQEKLCTFKSKNAEYAKAMKEFWKMIHDHCNERDESNIYDNKACEREAHETACNILNMTPEELANFMNEKSNTVNCWLANFNKITSKTNFSDGLAKFLFETTLDKIRASS